MKLKQHAIALAFSLPFAVAPAFAQDTATITQLGANSAASITQVGNRGANDASIAQGEFVANSSASISQSGVRNAVASINQGTGLAAFGDSLNAVIDQHDSTSVTARITQQGPEFSASVVQAGSVQSDVSVQQFGDLRGQGAVSVRVLDSERTTVDITTGPGARVEATQANVFNGNILVSSGIINPFARINQHDASNVTAHVFQAGPVDADIEQIGDGGTVIADQNGDADSLHVVQDGGIGGIGQGSLVSITQRDSGNTANVTQVGRGFVATIAQAGVGNTATINQHF